MNEQNEPISRRIHQKPTSGGAAKWVLAGLVAVGLGAAWWHFYQQPAQPAVHPELASPAAPVPESPAPAPVVAAPSEPVASPVEDPAPSHPIEPAADAQGNPPLASDDGTGLGAAVTAWLGGGAIQRYVATDQLAHRIVATVDNLPRKLAASRLWPLHPVGGRMAITQTDDGGMQIAPENAARYDGVVGFMGSIDMAQAAAFYRRAYPVLQQAYEELGYPGQRFNDRLVHAIDHLLQTPEPDAPLRLKLVQVQGQVAPEHPWLRYEFVDSDLQALSAGQKILVRMGVSHTQRIKAQLRALRGHIAQR